MPRERRFGRGLVALVVLAGVAVAIAVAGKILHANCMDSIAAAEAKVRTDHFWTGGDVAGIGMYEEIHWQLKVMGDGCTVLPIGPTDYRYAAVVKLHPGDLAVLRERCDWAPVGVNVWPGLEPYVPSGSVWLGCGEYTDAYGAGLLSTLHLDAVHGLAYVSSSTM